MKIEICFLKHGFRCKWSSVGGVASGGRHVAGLLHVQLDHKATGSKATTQGYHLRSVVDVDDCHW